MDSAGETWFEELRVYNQKAVSTTPLPDRDTFSLIEEWHCRIIGGALINWLKQIGPQFLQERQVLSSALGIDPEPFVVFTSGVPGLVAAREILGSEDEHILYLSDADYDNWIAENPDTQFQWHIHVWSKFIDPIGEGFLKAAQTAFPFSEGRICWQHSEGTLWAPQAGRGVDHLWVWDGNEPELLEEAFQSRVF